MRKTILPVAILLLFVVALVVFNLHTIAINEVCSLPAVRRSLRWIIMTVAETGVLFLIATLLLTLLAPASMRGLADRVAAWVGPRERLLSFLLALAVTGACAATAWGVLDAFANSADEYAFRFQGWTFAAGRLWNDPPAMLQAESPIYVWAIPGKWVGQYPPGWPAFLALADRFEFPDFWLNAVFIGLSAWLLAVILRRDGDPLTAFLGTACFVLSPFAIFNGASPFAHPVAVATGLLFAWAALRWLEEGRAWHVAVAGLAIGVLGVTRYLSAVPLFAPFALVVIWHWLRRRPMPGNSVTAIVVLAITAVPFAAGLLLYHYVLTGDPLKTGYWLTGYYATEMHFDPGTLKFGVTRTVYRLGELVRWTGPLLVGIYGIALLWKIWTRTFRFYDAVFPLSVLLLVSYPSLGGTRWGPRYYFDAYPFMILTTATGLRLLAASLGERWRPLLAAGVLTTFIGMALSYPFFAFHAARSIDDRQDLPRRLEAANLDNATVLVTTPSGTLCPMPVESQGRNGLETAGPVRIVRGDLADAAAVRAAYPDRKLWLYQSAPGTGEPELVPAP